MKHPNYTIKRTQKYEKDKKCLIVEIRMGESVPGYNLATPKHTWWKITLGTIVNHFIPGYIAQHSTTGKGEKRKLWTLKMYKLIGEELELKMFPEIKILVHPDGKVSLNHGGILYQGSLNRVICDLYKKLGISRPNTVHNHVTYKGNTLSERRCLIEQGILL